MAQGSEASRISRSAVRLIAGALFLVPLVHSSALAQPFALPREMLTAVLAMLLAGLMIGSHLWSDDLPGLRSPVLQLAAAFAVLSAVALWPALNRALGAWGLLETTGGVVIFWGTARFVREPRDAARLFGALLAAAALTAVGSLVQVAVPGAHLTPAGFSILPPSGGGATLGDPGLLCQLLIVALPVGIGAAALAVGRWRVACGAALGLLGATLFFIGRPEGWTVALMVSGLLLATRVLQVIMTDRGWSSLAPDPGGHSLWAALVGLCVAVAIVSAARWPALLPGGRPVRPLDSVTLLAPTTGDPAIDRVAAARGTVRLIGRHPLGVGPRNWRHAFLEVAWTEVDDSPFTLTHQAVHVGNNFLERTAETGLAGGIVFLALILLLLVQAGLAATGAAPGWRAVVFASFGALGAFGLASFLGAPFEEPSTGLTFWAIAGVVQAALGRSGGAPGVPAPLAARPREFVPRSLRRRRLGLVLAGLWVAAAGFCALGFARRVEASRLSLLARGAFMNGQYRTALRLLGRKASRRSPDPVDRARAGSAYLRLGFPKLAAREFTETLERSPYFLSAYLGRAAAYEASGRYDLADEDLNRALAIWPDNPQTRLALGKLNTTRGRLDAALATYVELAREEPSMPEPWFRMGELFMRRGQLDEAIEAYRVCSTKDPRYPGLAMRLGRAFFEKGLMQMALRYFQAAADVDPQDVQPRLEIANTHHAMGEFCRAVEALRAARDLESDAARRNRILDLIDDIEPRCEALAGG
ncbi:MAG: tetratricopeptide repeat protein [Acidobacteriota bacterium]